MTTMTVEEFKKYLAQNGIDDNHKQYDDLWSSYLFGGKSPNKVYDNINKLWIAGKLQSEPVSPEAPNLSEWELRDGTAE